MSEAQHIGTQSIEGEGFMAPARFKVTCRCLRCEREYSYVTARITDRDRPCPRKACKQASMDAEIEKRAINMAAIIESQRPPGHIGDKVVVKAVDETARIVMEDHKMTDLKDNVRTGDSMAPKLPGQMQGMADGFFGGEAMRKRMGLGKRQMDVLGRRAMAGAFRNMAVSPQAAVPGQRGESPLTFVRTEKVK